MVFTEVIKTKISLLKKKLVLLKEIFVLIAFPFILIIGINFALTSKVLN